MAILAILSVIYILCRFIKFLITETNDETSSKNINKNYDTYVNDCYYEPMKEQIMTMDFNKYINKNIPNYELWQERRNYLFDQIMRPDSAYSGLDYDLVFMLKETYDGYERSIKGKRLEKIVVELSNLLYGENILSTEGMRNIMLKEIGYSKKIITGGE